MLVIELIYIRRFLVEEIASCQLSVLLRIDQLVLRRGDPVLHRIRLILLIIQIQLLQAVFHQRLRVIRVINGEPVRIRRIGSDLTPKEARTKGMKGIHPNAVRSRSHQIVYTFSHFLRRLVREGDREDFIRIDPLLKHVCDAAGQGFRLAGSGARHDEYRPFHRLDRLPLPGI